MNCFREAVASIWVAGISMIYRSAIEEDLVHSARQQLTEAIQKVAAQSGLYDIKLGEIATEVKTRRLQMPKAELRNLLLRSRRIKLEQKSLADKTRLMESQLNALENNEFNKVVLSTLQTSAKAMQKMGLNKDLQKTDQVISELEEGMMHSQDMTTALSSNIGQDYGFDDNDLDHELGEILGLDIEPMFARQLQPPAKSDHMPVREEIKKEEEIREEAVLQPVEKQLENEPAVADEREECPGIPLAKISITTF